MRNLWERLLDQGNQCDPDPQPDPMGNPTEVVVVVGKPQGPPEPPTMIGREVH